jgi:hypothetical protein
MRNKAPLSNEIRVGEAAYLLGVAPPALVAMEKRGDLHVRRDAAGHRHYSLKEVVALVEKRRSSPTRAGRPTTRARLLRALAHAEAVAAELKRRGVHA